LLNGSHTSVGDVETQGLIHRGTICLFDGAEQLRQVMQHRERLNDFVEREWLGSRGSRREYGFCGSLLALSGSNARCDHSGRNARLEPVKVLGELAFAFDQGDPRPSDLGVLATSLGIGRDDCCHGRLDVLKVEQLREPPVDVGEQAVFADGQAGG
jgi:hypothetical protein